MHLVDTYNCSKFAIPMATFGFDKSKAVNACLFILNKTDKIDFHKLFKILYFAEREHLSKYARPITGDEYQAMNYGPVPSIIYDIFKAVEHKNNPFIDHNQYVGQFEVSRSGKTPFIQAKAKPDTDELAISEIELLDKSIAENKDLSFEKLTSKSHDQAWHTYSQSADIEMNYIDIAKAGGADENIIKYIQLLSENTSASLV